MSYKTKLFKVCACGSLVKSGHWKNHRVTGGTHAVTVEVAGCISCREFTAEEDRTDFYRRHTTCKGGKSNDPGFVKAYKAFRSQLVDVS